MLLKMLIKKLWAKKRSGQDHHFRSCLVIVKVQDKKLICNFIS